MKRSIAVAALMMIASSVQASDEGGFCMAVGELAKETMQLRQQGQSMVTLMKASKSSDTAEILIRAAYMEPRYETPSQRRESINEFEARMYLSCLRASAQIEAEANAR